MNEMILNKNTLLYFLSNELGDNGNWLVKTHVNADGSWCGHIEIKSTQCKAKDNSLYLNFISGQLK